MSLILNGTTGISDVDGTAAAPALTGTDTNTGIFFPAADTIGFSEGGVEVARFNSSGNLQTIGTISVGNATPSTSGAGITFPATQSASSNANTLDDYEEGTFSPTAIGQTSGTGTPTDQRGNYVKIGGWVFVQLYIAFDKNTLLGNLKISNLPFSSASTYYISTSCGYWTGLATAILNPTSYMGGGQSSFTVTKLTAAATNTNAPLTNTDLSASGNEFMFSLFYQVN